MRKAIQPEALADNAIKLISSDWMLITAGTSERFNTMTASWGGVGYLWNTPVVTIFIRPKRYTFEFVERHDTFSLTFFGAEYKKILGVLGSKSGRDMDKMADSGLTPYFTELGTPAFQEARITIECKKLYASMLVGENFLDKAPLTRWYSDTDPLHKMYVAEIVNLWIEE